MVEAGVPFDGLEGCPPWARRCQLQDRLCPGALDAPLLVAASAQLSCP